jgi:hypothetical protein
MKKNEKEFSVWDGSDAGDSFACCNIAPYRAFPPVATHNSGSVVRSFPVLIDTRAGNSRAQFHIFENG